MLRLHNFLYVFTLRQGTILIAVHQIALSSFLLVILLVGISHVGTMLSMLYNDMEDDADRSGYNEMTYGDPVFNYGSGKSTINQLRFANARNLASATVVFLYSTTIAMSVYLICCLALLYGSVKYKLKYLVPWILVASTGVLVMITVMVAAHSKTCIVTLIGGDGVYYFLCVTMVLTYIYGICAVTSFAVETNNGRCVRAIRAASDERGERLLLLDYAAHSSLLSSAQLNKLNTGTRSQFV